MDRQRVTQVRKKTGDGNYTTPIPIGAKAENITLANGTVLQDAVDELQSGKAGHEVLTYAEWNALSDNEKNNGTVYFIKNYTQERKNTASQISFNNSESGMRSTNVQAAIEEVKNASAPMVVDNLISPSSDMALSANQGRILNGLIENKHNKIVWDSDTNVISVTGIDLTMPTQNVYYQIGTQGFTFEENSTYLICAHAQVSDKTTECNASLTFCIGPSSSNDWSQKITAKIAADTAKMPRYAHFSTIMHFNEETTYYGWLASTLANTEARANWQMECIKII